jgi:hypothetical protein
MYPAYKMADVLDEYAITFFALLNEGKRMRYRHYQILATISDLPYMKGDKRTEFYNDLRWASTHPSDILNKDGAGSSDAEIKKLMG